MTLPTFNIDHVVKSDGTGLSSPTSTLIKRNSFCSLAENIVSEDELHYPLPSPRKNIRRHSNHDLCYDTSELTTVNNLSLSLSDQESQTEVAPKTRRFSFNSLSPNVFRKKKNTRKKSMTNEDSLQVSGTDRTDGSGNDESFDESNYLKKNQTDSAILSSTKPIQQSDNSVNNLEISGSIKLKKTASLSHIFDRSTYNTNIAGSTFTSDNANNKPKHNTDNNSSNKTNRKHSRNSSSQNGNDDNIIILRPTTSLNINATYSTQGNNNCKNRKTKTASKPTSPTQQASSFRDYSLPTSIVKRVSMKSKESHKKIHIDENVISKISHLRKSASLSSLDSVTSNDKMTFQQLTSTDKKFIDITRVAILEYTYKYKGCKHLSTTERNLIRECWTKLVSPTKKSEVNDTETFVMMEFSEFICSHLRALSA
eukprot:Awhi_evm1s8781